MKTLNEEQERALANLPGPIEIKIAVEYLAQESRKLDMSFVADQLNYASEAIDQYLALQCEAEISDKAVDEQAAPGKFAEADIFGRVSVAELETMLGLEVDDD